MKNKLTLILLLFLGINTFAQKYTSQFSQKGSSSIISLYRNTLETLHVKIYEEGKSDIKNADVQIVGGDLIYWKNDTIKFVPTKAKVTFIFSQSGKKLLIHTFKVRLVPKPEVYLASNDQRLKSTIPLVLLRSLKIACQVDDIYFRLHPNQSTMKVHKCTYFVERRGVKLMVGDWNSKFHSNSTINRIKKGDKLIIQVESFQQKLWNDQITILKGVERLEIMVE